MIDLFLMVCSYFFIDFDENVVLIVNVAEFFFVCFDVVGVCLVVEVGAFYGKFIWELFGWVEGTGVCVVVIDLMFESALSELVVECGDFELIEWMSIEVFVDVDVDFDVDVDVVIFDGDYNYYMFSEELCLIVDRVGGGHVLLLIFYDIGWLLGCCDVYYVFEWILVEYC